MNKKLEEKEMQYISTRDKNIRVSASQAIAQGLSKEGGLFVPESIPAISLAEIEKMRTMSYYERAQKVLSLYLTDFTQEELENCIQGAYGQGKFSSEKIAPTVKLQDNMNILELWRGPTCAFKDMALQLLPYLMTTSTKHIGSTDTIVILVATSGDTGKAALEGFKDVKDTKIIVFYPRDGVSETQKLQMMTQEGENVDVCAVKGNFDDTQNGVKRIFTDDKMISKLAANNMSFSSANSINWGRLVPQIVYYFSSYCDMLEAGQIQLGDKVNFVVPTGNFGNILAGFYAKQMGLPITQLVCASNANNILTDFLTTGTYDRNREFYMTASPSMDILISSNLERLLFHLSGEDDNQINTWMNALVNNGKYEVPSSLLAEIQKQFKAGYCDDKATKETIAQIYNAENYLCDTHTAVAVKVYLDYKEKSGDNTVSTVLSTANPYKFSVDVLGAVTGKTYTDLTEFEIIQTLYDITKEPIPEQIASLKEKDIRFEGVRDKEAMEDEVLAFLNI